MVLSKELPTFGCTSQSTTGGFGVEETLKITQGPLPEQAAPPSSILDDHFVALLTLGYSPGAL